MKRDLKVQGSVLKKVFECKFPRMLFERFVINGGGYEDVETPNWTKEEAHHVELLLLEGMLGKEKINDAPWLGDGRSDAYAESYVFITPKGYDWLQNRGYVRAFMNNVKSNIPTIMTSVAVVWALYYFGPPT